VAKKTLDKRMNTTGVAWAVLATSGLGLLLCSGCSQGPTDLRADLENTMGKVRASVESGDYESFVRLIEPSPKAKNRHLSKEQFAKGVSDPKAKKMLLELMFPDLKTQTKYIKTKTLGDWAAYYAETDLDDKNYLSVDMFLFRKVGGEWRVRGQVYGLCKARPGGEMAQKGLAAWKGTDDILNTIDTDPKFQIENIVKDADPEHPATGTGQPTSGGA